MSLLLVVNTPDDDIRGIVSDNVSAAGVTIGEPFPFGAAEHYRVLLYGADSTVVLKAIERLRHDRRVDFAAPCYSFDWGFVSKIYGVIERGYVQPLDQLNIRFKDGTSRLTIEVVLDWLGGEVLERPNPSDPIPDRRYRYAVRYPRGADPFAVAQNIGRTPVVEWAEPSLVTNVIPLGNVSKPLPTDAAGDDPWIQVCR